MTIYKVTIKYNIGKNGKIIIKADGKITMNNIQIINFTLQKLFEIINKSKVWLSTNDEILSSLP